MAASSPVSGLSWVSMRYRGMPIHVSFSGFELCQLHPHILSSPLLQPRTSASRAESRSERQVAWAIKTRRRSSVLPEVYTLVFRAAHPLLTFKWTLSVWMMPSELGRPLKVAISSVATFEPSVLPRQGPRKGVLVPRKTRMSKSSRWCCRESQAHPQYNRIGQPHFVLCLRWYVQACRLAAVRD